MEGWGGFLVEGVRLTHPLVTQTTDQPGVSPDNYDKQFLIRIRGQYGAGAKDDNSVHISLQSTEHLRGWILLHMTRAIYDYYELRFSLVLLLYSAPRSLLYIHNY